MQKKSEKRVAVITGASSGIGKEAAKALVGQGWKVIGIGRNTERCERAKAELLECAENPDDVVFLCGNLALMSETAAVAKNIATLVDRVDVLLNNAGGLTKELTVTPEGNENTFASNHLGHFLLTKMLLPLLVTSAESSPKGATRIINVASSAHEYCNEMDWEDLQMLNGFSSTPAYCRAKLANMLFTRGLASRLAGQGIVVHAMHPGIVASNFASHGDDAMQAFMADNSEVAISPADAADTLVWLASAEEPGSTTGKYYHNREVISASAAAGDDEAAERLWHTSESLVANALHS